jgi:hypothetical protein
MKNKAFYILAAAVSITAASCSKNGDVTPTVSATAKFTLNGTQYTEISSADSASTSSDGSQTFNILGVAGTSGSAQGQVGLIFAGPGKPKAGSYKVVGDATALTGTQVGIIAFDEPSSVKQYIYASTGKDNVSITVSISSSGKISATLPTIALAGNLFDNTDPKNTVTSTATTTLSGSVAEN